ncbi:MAG TPA: 50S ribosomal protein L21 [Candidatus Omnitrophota bacterium]|nr:50S ribosomal protein L21 [Candidatus Omnitrophota bacterium]HPT07960.1 50S ribosomal protein L21 [Candidatus Omnitrophota bacterium]
MYAIIEVGGKQYTVEKDQLIKVEKQAGNKGDDLSLEKVLLVSSDDKLEIGKPYIKNAAVLAEVVTQTQGPKVISFKYRRRKSSHSRNGHRQELTELKIKDIKLS